MTQRADDGSVRHDITGTGGRGPAPRGRWLVLGAFSLLVACTQLLWLTFAPITEHAHRLLGVSEGAIGDLAGLQPVMFVILALPTGRWMDRRFAAALSTGAALTAAGALVRLAGPGSYGWILAGQFAIAVGQPLVLNATTKIAARSFAPEQRTVAIAVGTAAQFVGILAAALTGGPLLRAGGLRLVLLTHAVIAVTAALAVLLAVRVPASYPADAPAAVSLGWLRRDREMWLLGGLLFIGVGTFNAMATWLDSILTSLGLTGVSGVLIAITTVAGIVGAAVLPGPAARHARRRAVLLAATALTVLVFPVIALTRDTYVIGVALSLEGFVLLAAFPVALDWSELHVGASRASTATGFLMMAGNLGGAVLVLVVQAVIGSPYLALAALSAIALPGLALAAALPAGAPPRRAAAPVSP